MPAQPSSSTSAPSSLLERLAHLGKPRQHQIGLAERAHPHLDGPVAGEAGAEAEGGDIAPVPRDGAAQDGDDPEAVALGQRQRKAALGDAEDRHVEGFAQAVEPGIGEAGDDEGAGGVALAPGQAQQRLDHRIHMDLGLDAGRTLRQSDAIDGGAARHAQAGHGRCDLPGHPLIAVGIDDQDALGHALARARASGSARSGAPPGRRNRPSPGRAMTCSPSKILRPRR